MKRTSMNTREWRNSVIREFFDRSNNIDELCISVKTYPTEKTISPGFVKGETIFRYEYDDRGIKRTRTNKIEEVSGYHLSDDIRDDIEIVLFKWCKKIVKAKKTNGKISIEAAVY